jgi:predicted dehydrogenase
VLAARKPLFVDKPFTASVKDAVALARLAREQGTPIFSSSSLRFTDDVQGVKRDPRVQQVQGAITWGPATLEPHHPDLFWYGIHAVEMLYTFMGPGCERVTRTHTAGADAVVGHWKDGRIGIVRGSRDSAQTYGQVVFGPKAIVTTPEPSNTPSNPSGSSASNGAPPKRSSYYGLLVAIVEFFRTGKSPVPIDETLEIMAFMEAADLSKARNGAPIAIADVLSPR